MSWLPCGRIVACLATHPTARPCAQEAHASRPCRVPPGHVVGLVAVSWGRVARLMAISWPPCYTPLSPMSRYKALYRDQVQKWAVAQPDFLHYFFFSSFIFFFHSCYWKTNYPKKYMLLLFFSFSSKPNKFIKIYFIHFSSNFTHCKTPEKYFFQHITFFFSFPVASLLLHTCNSLNTAILTLQNFQEFNCKLFFFLYKTWTNFPAFHNKISLCSNWNYCPEFIYFSFNSEPFCPKILEHLRLYFLGPSVQHNPYATHQAYKYITCTTIHTTHDHTSLMLYTPITHKTHACSVLILSRDFLGNHIPNYNI